MADDDDEPTARQQQAERQAARLDLHVLRLRDRSRRPSPAAQQGRVPDPARGAEEARIAAAHALATGTYVKAERISLADFLVDEWLPSRRPPVLEESTWHSYDRYIRLHVIPHIGAIPLQKLTPVDLNQLYRQLLESGRAPARARRGRSPAVSRASRRAPRRRPHLRAGRRAAPRPSSRTRRRSPRTPSPRSCVATAERRRDGPTVAGLTPRTVRYIHTIIHAALKDALRWNRVARNVADAATPPSAAAARSHRPKAWTAEQLRAFLDFVAESHYLPAWIFLATSGCRRGECLGLRWSDIDLDAATAVISRQVTALDHQVIVKELPKTKQAHLIRLDSGTVAMLKRLRRRAGRGEAPPRPRLPATRATCSASSTAGPTTPSGSPGSSTASRTTSTGTTPSEQLPTITLHGLRHTWATLALSAGIDIKIVSERLNHSSTHITREIYTHVTPPMQSDAAERVAKLIHGS